MINLHQNAEPILRFGYQERIAINSATGKTELPMNHPQKKPFSYRPFELKNVPAFDKKIGNLVNLLKSELLHCLATGVLPSAWFSMVQRRNPSKNTSRDKINETCDGGVAVLTHSCLNNANR